MLILLTTKMKGEITMCCTPNTHARQFDGLTPENCGCGCIGHKPSKIQLQKYRDHLQVELAAAEKQLKELDTQ